MGHVNQVTHLGVEAGIAVITVDSPPVNALGAAVRDGIDRAFRQAIDNPSVEAIVLIGGGRTFFAGADIAEFGKPAPPELREMILTIENSPKPTVAAIHGTALGGGFETALACNYRVAVPSARFGLPEVKLGLVPGAGGTQRLPRLVGARRALDIVTGGASFAAEDALDLGVLDALVAEGQLRETAIAFARNAVEQRWPLRRVRDLEVPEPGPQLFAEFRAANAKRFRGFEAPEAIIKCIEASTRQSFDEGMATERRHFSDLVDGGQSAAQRYMFFAVREAAKIPGLEPNTAPLAVERVGIVGAGLMGGGIAMNFLSAGIPVTIVEKRREALEQGMLTIRNNYENSARRGRLTIQDVERKLALLTPALDLAALSDCDLIIEAVFEDTELKKEVFGQLDAIARPGAILATNTSYLDVDEIASATSRPGSVVGFHFFSPANVMQLLEVVRGAKTEEQVVASGMAVAKRIGKVAVVSGVCHGFIGNRMLSVRRREADRLVLEGAMPWDVDRVLYDFGFPMGPYQMSDLAGLDLGWSKGISRGEPIRDRLCEIDRRGQKTMAGFYDYDEKRRGVPSSTVEELILELSAERGLERRHVDDDEILERCLLPMINEGAKILEEGIACRASDIDVVWAYGYGWPTYRGGPMFYADAIGVAAVRDKLREYEAKYGSDFAPTRLLDRLADEGHRFI